MSEQKKSTENLEQCFDGVVKGSILAIIEPNQLTDEVLDFVKQLNNRAVTTNQQICFVAFRNDVILKVKSIVSENFPVKYSEDYLSACELESIDNAAYEIIENWYNHKSLQERKPPLEYVGINLGRLLKYEMSHYMPFVLKRAKLVKNILLSEKPSRVIVLTDGTEPEYSCVKILELAIKALELDCEIVSIDFPPIPSDTEIAGKTAKQKLIDIVRPIVDIFTSLLLVIIGFLYWDLKLRSGRSPLIFMRDTNILHALTDYLSQNRNYRIIRIDLKAHLRQLINSYKRRAFHYSFLSFHAFRWTRQQHNALRNIQDIWRRIQECTNFQETFNYEGIKLWNLVQVQFTHFFENVLPERVIWISAMKRALKKYKPNVIVMHIDTAPIEMTMCAVARLANIPTIVIQHGIQAELRGHDDINTDKFAAWGPMHKERYIAWGNPPDKLEVTGSITFDKLYNRKTDPDVKVKMCQKLGLDANKKIFMIATRTNWPAYWTSAFRDADSETTMFREVLKALELCCEEQLVVKVHPGEIRDGMYQNALADVNPKRNHVVITKDVDLHDLIDASDMVIISSSTVALEAMILGKPVIIVNLTRREDLIPYAGSGAALGVYNAEDIAPAIQRVLSNPSLNEELAENRAKFIHDYAYKIDGKAIERVAALIDEMIR